MTDTGVLDVDELEFDLDDTDESVNYLVENPDIIDNMLEYIDPGDDEERVEVYFGRKIRRFYEVVVQMMEFVHDGGSLDDFRFGYGATTYRGETSDEDSDEGHNLFEGSPEEEAEESPEEEAEESYSDEEDEVPPPQGYAMPDVESSEIERLSDEYRSTLTGSRVPTKPMNIRSTFQDPSVPQNLIRVAQRSSTGQDMRTYNLGNAQVTVFMNR
jgi:hypothetical protein